jgi:hypothetical protein
VPTAPATRHHAEATRHLTSRTTPSAAEFARGIARTSASYAKQHGSAARIVNIHCVEASSGHYMCSYVVTRPRHSAECHLMQAMWTPESASTYTVTLAGRVRRCGTLREALRSLR